MTQISAKRQFVSVPSITGERTDGKLFGHQDKLERLPVPELEDTVAKYLRSLEPLLSESELANSKAAAKQFLESPISKTLQERLKAKAADPKVPNWLEDWWNEIAYLGYRDPVVPFVSYFFTFKDDKLRKKQTKRAAAIIRAALQFRRQLVTGELEPEAMKKQPICSYSYKYMFNACRIPKKPSDIVETYDPYANEYITVVRNNQFFSLPITRGSGAGQEYLSADELEAQLDIIKAKADSNLGVPVGVLTSDNRDNWADNRQKLIDANPKNAELLAEIERSAFLVALDSTSPVTRDELSRACWHGDGHNRFYDKPCQFIVFENGKAGFMGEHSMMDGTPTCRLSDYVAGQTLNNKVDLGVSSSGALPEPKALNFVGNSEVLKATKDAAVRFQGLIDGHDLKVLAYEGYGKTQMTKRYGYSPDAFVQMVIQLGYYKLYGRSDPTYEAATTRKFAHGRTETCRTVSNDSLAFVKTMESPTATVQDKVGAFRQAIKSHLAYMAECVEGRGVDRHILGLKLLLKPDEEKPSFFTDPALSRSCHWNLSTSQLSSEYFDGYGWSEVVPDGYGLAYMIKKDSFQVNVVCANNNQYNRNAEHLRHCLKEAASDIRSVLEAELLSREVKPKL
ncbi:Carnitine O-acetyltransferase mitochondrial [Mycoemilia scoparia]|uniref:Carnitine O-acetyltransferase, mitochondrial n=1 Tax=Mycoemilia scoparia TaxID=417184 RepID=A0A9W8A3S3_9FUNG|nr:Carnitine O-acetyltransferase mitochondrial [Mycoemilia scoparia]